MSFRLLLMLSGSTSVTGPMMQSGYCSASSGVSECTVKMETFVVMSVLPADIGENSPAFLSVIVDNSVNAENFLADGIYS